jgi:hypothetical protein
MSAGAGGPAVVPWEHVVQFYGCEDELAERVGGRLGAALVSGQPVVVVATAQHRRRFAEQMAAAGADVAAAQADGRLLMLDAAETMRRFLAGNRPDPDGFEQVIGGLIRQAAGTGRPVQVYGEMVALLWEAGHVTAALEIEGLWNDLAARLPFALTCGYPAQSVAGEDLAEPVEEVRRLHSAVVGPAGAVRSFEMVVGAPRAARHFVVQTLRGWGDGMLADDAAIVVTELAANAVLHARSAFTVAISRTGGRVRIAVRDEDAVPGRDDSAALTTTAGHGLWLVNAMASRWAAEPAPGGKTVWAEIG